MAEHLRQKRAAAILFSLIMACLLAAGGLLAGMYLCGHLGRAPKDYDEAAGYACGLLVGGTLGCVGGLASLWKFWPRATTKTPQPGKV
jgi:hypothetical protein